MIDSYPSKESENYPMSQSMAVLKLNNESNLVAIICENIKRAKFKFY